MHIIIMGNPVDGFNHIGPFADIDEALKYMDDEIKDNCWIVELDAPANDADELIIKDEGRGLIKD